MSIKSTTAPGIVRNGRNRAKRGAEAKVRAAVESEFAERLAAATSRWRRWRIRSEMEREIRRRAAAVAPPPDALY